MMGVKVGEKSEISNCNLSCPHLLEIKDRSFLADNVNFGNPVINKGRAILQKTCVDLGSSSFSLLNPNQNHSC